VKKGCRLGGGGSNSEEIENLRSFWDPCSSPQSAATEPCSDRGKAHTFFQGPSLEPAVNERPTVDISGAGGVHDVDLVSPLLYNFRPGESNAALFAQGQHHSPKQKVKEARIESTPSPSAHPGGHSPAPAATATILSPRMRTSPCTSPCGVTTSPSSMTVFISLSTCSKTSNSGQLQLNAPRRDTACGPDPRAYRPNLQDSKHTKRSSR